MGHPNWKRLAELGQLPIEMQDKVSGDILDTQNNAVKNIEEMVEEVKTTEVKEVNTIEDILNNKMSYEEELNLKTKIELESILMEAKADVGGNRKQLITRILALPKEEVKEEEKVVEDAPQGEFIDELLK